jgi:glycopeptide antibiotics resistance protein
MSPNDSEKPPNMIIKRVAFLYATLACTGFILYGSLLPFEIRHKTLVEAWDLFRHIPYLRLGVGSRADWIANIVLYIPVSFFADAWLSNGSGICARRINRIALVVVAGAALAVAVEFTQIWFAPRTVSFNDIIAEIIGTVLGVALWESVGRRLSVLGVKIMAGGPAAVQSAAVLYVLAYIALSLFPYDFTVSGQVLAAKLANGRASWLWAACGGGFICLVKLIAEVVAVMPIGALLGMLFRQDRRWTLRTALYAGLGLGLIIELCQFFLASGVSQGMSVLTRGVGVVLGLILYRNFSWYYVNKVLPYLRPMMVIAAVPYGFALLDLNRWFSSHWLGWAEAGRRLTKLHFLPFYYHYYTAEAVAVVSVIYQFGLYAPFGAAVWLWRWVGGDTGAGGRSLIVPVAAAAVTAFVVEAGKLFISGEHPDPTNVLIAAAAALSGYLLSRYFFMIAAEARPARLRELKARK